MYACLASLPSSFRHSAKVSWYELSLCAAFARGTPYCDFTRFAIMSSLCSRYLLLLLKQIVWNELSVHREQRTHQTVLHRLVPLTAQHAHASSADAHN